MRPAVKQSGAACGAEIGFDLSQDIDDPTSLKIKQYSTTILSSSSQQPDRCYRLLLVQLVLFVV